MVQRGGVGSPATFDPRRALCLHPALAVVDAATPRLWHPRSAQVKRLEPPELGELLAAFVRPRRPAEALDDLQRAGAVDSAERGEGLISRCVAAGWLVDAAATGATAAPVSATAAAADAPAAAPRPATDDPPGGDTLFGAPRRTPAQALVDRPHVAAVGVPYDAGATSRRGARAGPGELRRVSGTAFTYTERAGHPVGAWDPVVGARVLTGATVADLGDLAGTAPARNGVVLDRLRQTVAHLAGQGTLPVVLGGDHSLALAVLAGQVQAHRRLGVVHVDAHADHTADDGSDWRTGAHHANFLTWALRDEHVTRVVQLGVRQREPGAAPPVDPRVVVWPGVTAVAAPLDQVLADLPADVAWHVTVDVDALDPTVLAATGTPVPGGFDAAELAALLAGIAARRRVVGVDVCELAPDLGRQADAMTAAELLVRLLAAATDPRDPT